MWGGTNNKLTPLPLAHLCTNVVCMSIHHPVLRETYQKLANRHAVIFLMFPR